MTNRTAAARYARALLEVAVDEKVDLDQIDRELAAFDDLVRRNPALQTALHNPAVSAPKKRAAIVELTKRVGNAPIVAKLLALLAERDRLILLSNLMEAYRERLLDYKKIIRAEITTASPLPDGRARAIEASLSKATGRSVALETRVDPGIVGGIIAKIGSTVYDGSVTRQLERLKEQLQQQ